MDKRYQIFISSTFTDLQDERQAVLKAILELNHMPAGMELFPATDDTAWELIKDVIDSSDYYVLIIGGRYGSLDEAGIGYTEKEYDYAVSTKKPVIALLHANPDNLPRGKTESDPQSWEKLKKFRAKVEKAHTRVTWQNAEELKSKVIVGLTSETRRHPAIGWVRANNIPSDATIAEVLALKNRITELEQHNAKTSFQPPIGAEQLAQGEDTFEVAFAFIARVVGERFSNSQDQRYSAKLKITWNSLFGAVAPSMIIEASDRAVNRALVDYLENEARRLYQSWQTKEFKERFITEITFDDHEIETCIVQFRALGLIIENNRKRSLKDYGTYWTLTPYGNTVMVQLRAIRREPLSNTTVTAPGKDAALSGKK